MPGFIFESGGIGSFTGQASDAELAAHEADTTSIHGITDTSVLAVRNAGQTFSGTQAFSIVTATGNITTNSYLETDDKVYADSTVISQFGTATRTDIGAVGPSSQSGILFASGQANPCNIYRSAADTLTTDDQFIAADGLAGKYVSAAGRVNGADTDFTVTPPNGAMYVVRNSTDSKVYLTARANGAWKAIEII